MRFLPLLMLSMLSGCFFISKDKFDEARDALDEDGDGHPFKGTDQDCDDLDPLQTPGAEEIPYDGIDNDCADGDLIDIDGDKIAGIAKADYEKLSHKRIDGTVIQAVFPDNLDADQVDCADDPAAEPEAAKVFPGQTVKFYDGIDNDCSGINDFDQDGDTFVLAGTLDELEAYNTRWGLTLEAQDGDCADDEGQDNINPGITNDAWYDGVDSNCDGVNDFDQDGDGFMPDSVTLADYEDFVDTFLGGVGPEPFFGDCLDAVDSAIAALPENVNPGKLDDAFYDGIDTDCDGSNDFDQDGDNTIRTADSAAFDAFVDAWDIDFNEKDIILGDCNDLDATIHPNGEDVFEFAQEVLEDAIDQDCDGGVDTMPLRPLAAGVKDPRGVVVQSNDEHYLLAYGASRVDVQPTATSNRVFVLAFDKEVESGDPDALPLTTVALATSNTEATTLGGGLDLEGTADRFLVSYSHLTVGGSGVSGTNLLSRLYRWSGPAGTPPNTYVLATGDTSTGTQSLSSFTNNLNDVDALTFPSDPDGDTVLNDWALWTVACGDGRGVVSHVPGAGLPKPALGSQDPPLTRSNSVASQGNLGGTTCFLDGTDSIDMQAVFCLSDGCTSYDIDIQTAQPWQLTLTEALDQPWAAIKPKTIDQHGGDLVVRHTIDGGAEVVTLFTETESLELLGGEAALAADVQWVGDDLFVVAATGDTIMLEWGDPDGTMALAEFEFDQFDDEIEDSLGGGANVSDLALTDVSVFADEDRVFLAASGANLGTGPVIGDPPFDPVPNQGRIVWVALDR